MVSSSSIVRAARAQSRTIVASGQRECQRDGSHTITDTTHPRSQECATTGMRSLDGVSAPECKKRTNLWILWKTQDSIVPSLWITPRGALSPGASSDRIHDVQESILWTRCTFKTPVQRPCLRRARHMGPRSSRTVIHSPAGGAGALSSLIHNVGRGTVPESV